MFACSEQHKDNTTSLSFVVARSLSCLTMEFPLVDVPVHIQNLLHTRNNVRVRGTQDWSAQFWVTLRSFLILKYPVNPSEEERQRVLLTLSHFADMLPCPECQRHFKEHAQRAYSHTVSRAALFAWSVTLQNMLNAKNKRPMVTLESAARMFLHQDQINTGLRNTLACLHNSVTQNPQGTPNCHGEHVPLHTPPSQRKMPMHAYENAVFLESSSFTGMFVACALAFVGVSLCMYIWKQMIRSHSDSSSKGVRQERWSSISPTPSPQINP